MPNKFTAKLDALETSRPESEYFYWVDIDNIHPNMGLLTNQMIEFTQDDDAAKVLMLCLIAELSDQDLEECFPKLFSPSSTPEKV